MIKAFRMCLSIQFTLGDAFFFYHVFSFAYDYFAQPVFAVRLQDADSFELACLVYDADPSCAGRLILMINQDMPALFPKRIELIKFIGFRYLLFLNEYCFSNLKRCL